MGLMKAVARVVATAVARVVETEVGKEVEMAAVKAVATAAVKAVAKAERVAAWEAAMLLRHRTNTRSRSRMLCRYSRNRGFRSREATVDWC